MKRRRRPARDEVPPNDLLEFLNDCAEEFRCPLTESEIAAIVEKRVGSVSDLDLIGLALARSPQFARTRTRRYITREALLAGASIRIEPDPDEIDKGILIPGHRFLPLWWGREAEEITAEDADGVLIPYTVVSLSFSQAFPFHYLLGYNWTPEFLREQAEHAITEECSFHALDLNRFYAERDFRPGDFLIVEVRDPWQKEIVLHHENREAALQNVPAIRKSDIQLEKAFLQTLEEPYVLWSIPEQLFQALALAPVSVRHNPGSTFERFLARTSSFTLQEVGLEMAAFPRNTSPFQLAVRRSALENAQPDVFADPLDQLLTRLGVNLHSASLAGLLRLAASANQTCPTVVERIIPWDRIDGTSRSDAKELRSHITRLWNQARKEERLNPITQEMATLLRRAASLKERVLEILRQLDFLGLKAEHLPSRPLLRMVEIDELAECILQLDTETEESFCKAADLAELVAEVESHLDRLQEEILTEAYVS